MKSGRISILWLSDYDQKRGNATEAQKSSPALWMYNGVHLAGDQMIANRSTVIKKQNRRAASLDHRVEIAAPVAFENGG